MKRIGLATFVPFALVACASTSWPSRVDSPNIYGVPDHFLVVDAATGATSEPSDAACRNPMADPRDATRLTLIRSNAGFGDYQPETPSYGLGEDQLLRINCRDGTPVGVTTGAP